MMHRPARYLWLLAMMPLCAAADQGADHSARGAALLAPFKSELKAALMAGMEQGLATAIEACSLEAPRIASALSVDGVRVGRSSHRLRNPVNAAPGWVEPVLAAWAEDPSDLEPRSFVLDETRVGYVEPIRVQPLCLGCHGTTLSPEVEGTIAERYPDDEATGFEAGDFRGVFWVEFPIDVID